MEFSLLHLPDGVLHRICEFIPRKNAVRITCRVLKSITDGTIRKAQGSGDSRHLARLPALEKVIVDIPGVQTKNVMHAIETVRNVPQPDVDIISIAACRSLKTLRFWNMATNDASALSSLISLSSLSIVTSRPLDTAPTASMTNLRNLELVCLSPEPLKISGLPASLELLTMYATIPADLSPLKHLKNLTGLILQGSCDTADLYVLKDMTKLTRLALSRMSRVNNLEPLYNMVDMDTLHLSHMWNVESLAPLRGMTNMRSIYMYNMYSVTSLRPLVSMRTLNKLHLYGCRVSLDTAELASIKQLEIVVRVTNEM